MKKIEIQNVSKKIGRKKVLKNVTEDIYSGEVFGLLGPNGAGKTTLIKIIMGLMRPSEGRILIERNDIEKEFCRCVANVRALIEQPALYPHLTGYDNLKVFASMDGVKTERINEVIELIGLAGDIHRKSAEYSLGMKQRLGIGIALLSNPQILILDEPANGLDPEGILELRMYLQKIAKEDDIAVVVSSHILAEMNQLCERFAIMKNGRLLKAISKKEFFLDEDVMEYVIEIDNNLEALKVLQPEYSAALRDNGIMIRAKRKEMPKINRKLVNSGMNVYSIVTVENPLEKYYFDIINEKDTGEIND